MDINADWLDDKIVSSQHPHNAQLQNGLRVVVLHQPERVQSVLRFFVACGSRFETPHNAGISHLLEHMLFQGNRQHASSALLEEGFERAGVFAPEAMTGVEESEYRLSCHAQALPQAIEKLAALLREPLLLPQQVMREQAIVLEELLDAYNAKGYVIDADQLLLRFIWQEHPLGYPVGGSPQTVQKLNADMLRQWHAHHYQPWRCVVGVAGPTTPKGVLTQIEAHFGDWQNHPSTLAPSPPGASPISPMVSSPKALASRQFGPCLCWQKDTNSQLSLLLRFLGPGYCHASLKPIEMLLDILDGGIGSRLQRILREEKTHLYYVSADYISHWDVGYLDIQLSFHPKHLKTTVNQVLDILEDLRNNLPSKDECDIARRRCIMQLWHGMDSAFAQLERYAWPLLYSKVHSENEESEQFRRVTPMNVRSAAQSLLYGRNAYVALTGPVTVPALKWLSQTLSTWASLPCKVAQGEKVL